MDPSFDRSRRHFVRGLAGSAIAASGFLPLRLRSIAEATTVAAGRDRSAAAVLAGSEFDLEIGQLEVNVTGSARAATVVNGRLPGPVLRWREGDTVTVRVTNRLAVPTSIHWHGIVLPADMDGVPGVSFKGIEPGTTFEYRFPVKQSGTYWYHSHSRFQEQTGLYGALLIEPRNAEHYAANREHVVLLSDWTDSDPERLYRVLKLHSDYFNFGKRTAGDFLSDVRSRGWRDALAERRMWGAMRMTPTDLADVSGCAYTYLMNGVPPAGNWTALFRPGETVRLRCINGSSMTYFDVRIPGLKLTVVAADGQDVEPVTIDEFRIGPAEVYDVLVEPKEERAYALFAQSVDRSGYALGALAPRAGMNADAPVPDTRALLTMVDMGMGHAMNMGHQMSAGMSMQPTDRLEDPGVGLRDNGRRVLTYADLHTIGGALDGRDSGREIELHLTGHMSRFIWSFDDRKFSDSQPLRLHFGERLTLTLINDSMMLHPIHLHGMWSEVYSGDGHFLVRKHTVTVQPGQRLSYRITADAPGTWAYHCHLLYHMEAGMFREVVVA
jgi:CopA family copper-resistance protein